MSTVIETPETGQALALIVNQKPEIVLLDKEKGEAFYRECKAEVEAFVPDVTTEKGRKEIAALAYKVARTKTAIDNAGKTLNEKLREQINVVDESRRDIREKFDALKEQARKPLTDWEEAEKARSERTDKILMSMVQARMVLSTDTSATVTETLAAVQAEQVTAELYGDAIAQVLTEKNLTETVLHDSISRLKQQEAEQAELAQLRAEKAERDARDAAERKAAEERAAAERKEAERKRLEEERIERERIAAEKAEADRIAREKAESERIEKARAEAAEQARIKAERAAQEKIDAERRTLKEAADREAAELQRKHDEEVAQLRREAAERAERDLRIQQESDRIRAEQQARDEEFNRLANDSLHRAAVIGAAEDALKAGGVSGMQAKRVMALIAAGKIPRVEITY